MISRNFIKTLILILLIDSLRTLVESSYFGAWYTSLSGLIPIDIYNFLAKPQIVFFPKFLNLTAALIIIQILIRRWLPQETVKIQQLQDKVSTQDKTISFTRSELADTQNRLHIAIENTGIGIWDYDPQIDSVKCSEELCSLLEHPPENNPIGIKNFLELIEENNRETVSDHINSCIENEDKSFNLDTKMVTSSGKLKWIQLSGKCISGPDDTDRIIGTCFNINERKENEHRIIDSLEEKKILLGEVHHRVKNNMAILSAFLELKAFNSDNVETVQILKDSSQRIQAMALIHNQLYNNSDFRRINLNDYIPKLIEDILNTYNYLHRKVDSIVEVEEIIMDFNSLITLGLIINEIITNSLKHAFNDVKSPLISSIVKTDSSRNIILSLADNGLGMNADTKSSGNNPIGLTMIEKLVQQLSGRYTVGNDGGTAYTITLPPQG